ncbi:hypothetical protein ElyMa_006054200 [Elysia marginata]|uniref:Uncharacterized protein n=1 Tax=Elysia marginata TaxID=1093978 RepID=A0AAV4GLS2_9GAST|nr:hypothetical protein ElyMa_006054200 [Elysia marginata]
MVYSSLLPPPSLGLQSPSLPHLDHNYSKSSSVPEVSKGLKCDENTYESDMLCDLDLDDLDFSLSVFDMDTESIANTNFQDFVDTTLSLCNSADAFAASLGRQDTVALTSHFSINSSVTSSSTRSTTLNSTESRLGNSLVPESTLALCSPSHTSIPTKCSSCFESEAIDNAGCLYSSCQRDQTTLSSSTSYGKKLKPGDYLPPLYIDTHSYGVGDVTDSLLLLKNVPPSDGQLTCSQSEGYPNTMENKRQQQFSNVADATQLAMSTVAATETRMFTESSCLLTPLSLSEFAFSDSEKPLEQREQRIGQSAEFDDSSVEDLDLESISDFQKYLTEANLDLRTLPSPQSLSSTDSQHNCISRTKTQHMVPDERWAEEKNTDTSSVSSKLRLSILDNVPSKDELTSWLDGCEFNMASTPPISPCLSPDWREDKDSQMDIGQPSKHETNILDLFSDDNAHAFLNDDSAICHMRVSQFI